MTQDDKKDNERYLRWQDYRISQMSFSINLFIGLAIASIGFVISKDSGIVCESKNAVILIWAVSLLSGVISTVSRLADFRYTARKIRRNDNSYKTLIDYLGHVTWIGFGVQLVSYLIGALILLWRCVL